MHLSLLIGIRRAVILICFNHLATEALTILPSLEGIKLEILKDLHSQIIYRRTLKSKPFLNFRIQTILKLITLSITRSVLKIILTVPNIKWCKIVSKHPHKLMHWVTKFWLLHQFQATTLILNWSAKPSPTTVLSCCLWTTQSFCKSWLWMWLIRSDRQWCLTLKS